MRMAMRMQEIHPALVHFPIALLPATLAADALGRVTGNRTLLEAGRQGMRVAAGSVLISAVAGLMAQEEVRASGKAHDLLVTHRNLNAGLLGLTVGMSARRARRKRPSLSYLLTGLAGLGAMTYSAYLGGKMVYEHGVGVNPANGLREAEAPEVTLGNAGEVAQLGARQVIRGAKHAVADLLRGEIAPALGDGRPARTSPAGPPVRQ
jgi:uncharacterized membrane protein